MKEQKTTKRLLSILLCLVLMIGMLPTMALAEEWGRVPSDSKTDTFEYADRILDVLIVKHVRQNGTEAPPAETFEFEVEDTARGEKHPLSYYGIGVEDLKLSTNGVNDVEKTLRFRVPTKKDYTPYHWDAVTKSGTDTVAWYSKTFLLKEKNDGKPGWTYSTADYALTFWYDIEHNSMDLRLHQIGNDVYYRTAEFTNTYSSTSYELPFTKTVKQGGNTAPGKETFALEIFDVGVSSMEAHAKDLYTATVTTKGAGTYDGKLLISGPADQVEALLCEGFYVREKDRGADHWTYDDAVWHIKPQYEQTSGQTVVNVPLVSTNTPLEATVMNYQLAIYPTTKMKGANGIYYEDSETAVEKMTFTNTYTYDAEVIPPAATITANTTDTQGKPLTGASFVLTDSRGREAYTATSNANGIVRFPDVSNGTYTLLEKSAPKGYVASDETYTLTVSDSRITMNGKDYTPVTFVNRKAAELNRTDHLAFLSGYANGTFEPDRNMTRAEVTTMFARLLTEKMAADQTYSNTFSDVAKSHWAANYIGYMQQFGIITGYADGSFRPDASVTRAEFAAIASRFERLTEGTKSFSDVPSSHWAAKYINFAATRGWVNGYADGTFRPNNSITRAEVAAVTCRLLERNADQSYIRSHLSELRAFTDVSESHWAYWYTMEAANGHDYTKSGSSETWSRTYR
ncbi:S-layer homology domain-containing protein [Dysosmobacter sp.]|uniref:S-layer homology domain-containing protein n=1 Tax=Dysosmobacter sp. TaxID=2591382 RepID=UPI003A948B9D